MKPAQGHKLDMWEMYHYLSMYYLRLCFLQKKNPKIQTITFHWIQNLVKYSRVFYVS